MTEVPFADLHRHHVPIANELRAAFETVLEQSDFVLGEQVERFEAEFGRFCAVDHCVGVASGTAALTLSLLAAGVEPGDEVIVPAHTYIASPLAVLHAGGVPVFCDVLPATGLIDVESAARVVSERTRVIMPVHLYGQVCDMGPVQRLAGEHRLLVLEDAAQAHGARRDGRCAGSFGTAGCFSFYPSKNLGALGNGGAICTDDADLAARARRLRDLGQRRKGEHMEAGFNERLDGLQAAMLRVKLQHLDADNALRRARAALYREQLPAELSTLHEDAGSHCVYHLFPVRHYERDELRTRLSSRGVQTGVHYWPAAHRQPPFTLAGVRRTGLGTAESWSEQELSLPMFAELTECEVERVAEAARSALVEATP